MKHEPFTKQIGVKKKKKKQTIIFTQKSSRISQHGTKKMKTSN